MDTTGISGLVIRGRINYGHDGGFLLGYQGVEDRQESAFRIFCWKVGKESTDLRSSSLSFEKIRL